MDERGWWKEEVPVRLKPTVRLSVNNTAQAASLLLNEWPENAGPKHLAARKAVLKALENFSDQRALMRARKAFAEAAKEAGIDTK